MIVDCHTQIWAAGRQTDEESADFLARQSRPGRALSALPADHLQSAKCVDYALVMGLCGAGDIAASNQYIAEHVAKNPTTMIGVAVVNPLADDALASAEAALAQAEFKALAVSPAIQGFHPAHSKAMRVYDLAQQRRAPLLLAQGTPFPRQARMEFARPSLLDEIALSFPGLTMVLSSLGHPYVEEAVALIGKHPRVYADLAGLTDRAWQMYNALLLAHHFNVMDKVLFGSGFPFCTAAQAIESLYRLRELTQGTNLPSIPREVLRSVIERNSLAALGIAAPAASSGPDLQRPAQAYTLRSGQ
jgi:hypothetical protein